MAPPKKRRVIAVDDLSWKAVALPERLDDAEGFYGLEEIDDVEVVREQGSNIISFRASAGRNLAHVNDTETEPDDQAESEWEGFGDDGDDVDQPRNSSSSKTPEAPKKTVNKKKATESKKATKLKAASTETGESIQEVKSKHDRGLTVTNGFQHLDNEMYEDSGVDVSAWSNLDLSADITTALSRMGFAKPTAIQLASIPEALNDHDVIGKASTGSGKTLAYGVPIFEKFLSRRSRQEETNPPIALALAPTRELAHQISKHLAELASKLPSQGPRIATITGGLSVLKQQRLLKDADIIVATPGRLWEVINSQAGLLSDLRKISLLVVDEADRLLSEGHFKELEEILKSLDRTDVSGEDIDGELDRPKRQTLVFSATFQKSLQRKLAGKDKLQDTAMMSDRESMEYLLDKLNFREDKPKYIDVNPVSQMADNLKEGLLECGANEKDLYLYALLLQFPKARTLIFSNSINAARRITPFLRNLGLNAQALHSQMAQKARLRAIERFAAQDGSILVATDVAARGLDIPQVQLVAHYHVPRQADVYVHRSGRTARAENAGSSVLLCAPDEVTPVRRLVAKVHAQHAARGANGGRISTGAFIRTLDLDRQVVNRLKERATLAKQIADIELAKEKHRSEDSWLKKAAEDLGVDYDEDDFAAGGDGDRGGKKGRKRREKEESDRAVSKQNVTGLKAALGRLLAQRVNVGVSERYLSAGGIDVEQLLKEKKSGDIGTFLGQVNLFGLEA